MAFVVVAVIAVVVASDALDFLNRRTTRPRLTSAAK